MQIHAISNYYQKANIKDYNQNFNGQWVKTEEYAPYPHEDTKATIMSYIPDANETIPEIERNFAAKAGNTNIFNPNYINTISGINYRVDSSKSLEMRKVALTILSTDCMRKGDYVAAVASKLAIAKILQKQHKDHDQFLTEEGVKSIYREANADQKGKIFDMIMQYNQDMAFELQ